MNTTNRVLLVVRDILITIALIFAILCIANGLSGCSSVKKTSKSSSSKDSVAVIYSATEVVKDSTHLITGDSSAVTEREAISSYERVTEFEFDTSGSLLSSNGTAEDYITGHIKKITVREKGHNTQKEIQKVNKAVANETTLHTTAKDIYYAGTAVTTATATLNHSRTSFNFFWPLLMIAITAGVLFAGYKFKQKLV